MEKIDKYIIDNKADIIQERSPFGTKKMLYFLIVSTPLILFLFFITTTDYISSGDLKMAIRTFGGAFFFGFWLMYLIEKIRKNKKQQPIK